MRRSEDGSITGRTTADNPTKGNTFIVWRQGPVDDFVLRLKYKITGGNSGVLSFDGSLVTFSNLEPIDEQFSGPLPKQMCGGDDGGQHRLHVAPERKAVEAALQGVALIAQPDPVLALPADLAEFGSQQTFFGEACGAQLRRYLAPGVPAELQQGAGRARATCSQTRGAPPSVRGPAFLGDDRAIEDPR